MNVYFDAIATRVIFIKITLKISMFLFRRKSAGIQDAVQMEYVDGVA